MGEIEHSFVVSVECITYNHTRYIRDTMTGFVNQETCFPYVCVLVDDASIDGEPKVIKHYMETDFVSPAQTEETDDYFFIYSQNKWNKNCFFAVYLLKNNHYSINKSKELYFNTFRKSTKYLALCEGDDYWTDSLKLQKQVSYLDSHSSCSLCHTAFSFYYSNENRFKRHVIKNKQYDNEDIREKILENDAYRIQTVTTMFRCSDYLYVTSKDPILFSGHFKMGDTQLWICLLSIGNIGYINDDTSVYRILENSASHQEDISKRLAFNLSVLEMRLYVRKNYIGDSLFKWIIDKMRFYRALCLYLQIDKEFRPVYKNVCTNLVVYFSGKKPFSIYAKKCLNNYK